MSKKIFSIIDSYTWLETMKHLKRLDNNPTKWILTEKYEVGKELIRVIAYFNKKIEPNFQEGYKLIKKNLRNLNINLVLTYIFAKKVPQLYTGFDGYTGKNILSIIENIILFILLSVNLIGIILCTFYTYKTFFTKSGKEI